jgi:16S rRNA (cytosine967-C5)-methyltransferase
VDAPCSALGTLSRHSDARWTKQAGDLPRLQELQLEILSNAAKLLKKGGVLVYSTCTITPKENDRVVAKFLETGEDFTVRDSSEFVNPAVVDESGMVRTLPHIHKIDGSFACRLEKR